jgi:hypothetical protein
MENPLPSAGRLGSGAGGRAGPGEGRAAKGGRDLLAREKGPAGGSRSPPGPDCASALSSSAPGGGDARILRMIPGKSVVPACRSPMNFLLRLKRMGSRTAPMEAARAHRGGAFPVRPAVMPPAAGPMEWSPANYLARPASLASMTRICRWV